MAEHLKVTLHTLKQAGFILAAHKTDSAETASQRKDYLGFTIDSESMKVYAQADKLHAAQQVVHTLNQAR